MASAPFDIDALILEVAKRHQVLLTPDDPIFVALTLNSLVMTQTIGQIEAHIELCKEQASVAAAEQIAISKALAEQIITAGAVYLVAELQTAGTEAAAALRDAVKRDLAPLPSKKTSNWTGISDAYFIMTLGLLVAGAAAAIVIALPL